MFSHNYNLWAISTVTEGSQIICAPINRLYNFKKKQTKPQNLRQARAATIPIKDNLYRSHLVWIIDINSQEIYH